MMKHRHYEMIVAKAANMDLVVFTNGSGKWQELDCMPRWGDKKYFLCLPRHKEAALNSLNGGESQANYGDRWTDANCGIPVKWGDDWWYMSDKCESRIKPRKQKRWIAIIPCGRVTPEHYASKEEIIERCFAPNGFDGWQFIEIEIEV